MASADQLIQVFNLAKLRPAGPERDAFLAEACGDDAELRVQILSLLKAHDKAGVFLEIAGDMEAHADRIEGDRELDND